MALAYPYEEEAFNIRRRMVDDLLSELRERALVSGDLREVRLVETHDKYFVAPSRELQKAIDDLFGAETYYARVDTTLPEKPKRAWERKSEPAMAE